MEIAEENILESIDCIPHLTDKNRCNIDQCIEIIYQRFLPMIFYSRTIHHVFVYHVHAAIPQNDTERICRILSRDT